MCANCFFLIELYVSLTNRVLHNRSSQILFDFWPIISPEQNWPKSHELVFFTLCSAYVQLFGMSVVIMSPCNFLCFQRCLLFHIPSLVSWYRYTHVLKLVKYFMQGLPLLFSPLMHYNSINVTTTFPLITCSKIPTAVL